MPRVFPIRTWLISGLVVLLTVAGTPASGQSRASEQRIFQAFVDGDHALAVRLLERHLQHHPNDAIMLYNAACAHALLGHRDESADYLRKSVQAGLRDVQQIKGDPDLATIRDHPTFKEIVARVEWSASREAQSALARWKQRYGDTDYRYERDDDRHIAYATALDETAHLQMRDMLEEEADHLRASLLPAKPRNYVLIAVPTPTDARRIFGSEQIGGIYEHTKRQLIARDIGASLRHEFFHAMHYAHMDQIGQFHPLWVQEGLASLYEDYRLRADASITFLPNERHNVVKSLARGGRLVRWRDLMKFTDDRFMTQATHLYPQVRSIFEFVAAEGKLESWYAALIRNFDEDKTGALAFESAFEMPITDVERRWRRWIGRRPMIDNIVGSGDASLGIDCSPGGSNDGVRIREILADSAAAESRLLEGDVVVSVDGRPTRSVTALQAIIARHRVGDVVRVRARRGDEYFTVVIRLKPLGPMRW